MYDGLIKNKIYDNKTGNIRHSNHNMRRFDILGYPCRTQRN